MICRTWCRGETLAEQDARLKSLFLIRTGVLVVTRKEAGSDVEIARLSPGDYFGEAGLFAGQGEPGTVRAMTLAVVYEVDQAAMAKMMKDRPGTAEDIGLTLSHRAEQAATNDDAESPPSSMRSVSELVDRIRSAFELA
ncbi:MAG: Crp/Fnr family transcriptional regulator [Alphaproteobacteria bacterium]|nr:Crp/Fnr family transcriptional regulator [Alphaproteobacteria bacterium]